MLNNIFAIWMVAKNPYSVILYYSDIEHQNQFENHIISISVRSVQLNILVFGAHPDDVELGCGGLLIREARQGNNIFLCTLTRGSRSGDPDQRTQELEQSARFIGATKLWIGDFEDTQLSVNDRLINYLEHFIKMANPDVIFTHSLLDNHHDHRALATCTLEAGRFVSSILSYEIPITKEFRPQLYYDISDIIDEKIALIDLFLSQKDKAFLKSHAIKSVAGFRAVQSRLNITNGYAEAFEVHKLSLGQDFSLFKVPQLTASLTMSAEDSRRREKEPVRNNFL